MKTGAGLRGIVPAVGRWDFDGTYASGALGGVFSVGVFQYAQGRKALRRSPALARVRGLANKPDTVRRDAIRLCELLEAGEDHGTAVKRVARDASSLSVRMVKR